MLILLAASIPISIAATNVMLSIGLLLVIVRFTLGNLKLIESGKLISLSILGFVLIDCFASVLSGYPIDIHGILEDKWVLVLFPVAMLLAEDTEQINNTALALVISAGLVGLYAVIQFATGLDAIQQRELEPFGPAYIALGFFNHHLTLGGVLLAVLAIGGTIVLFGKDVSNRKWLIVPVVLTILGLLGSQARSAILGFGAAVVIFIILAEKSIRKYLIIVVLAGSIALLLVVPGLTERFMLVFSQHSDYNEGPRLRLWQTSVKIVEDNPVFGVGQGNFGLVFDKYKVPGLYKSTAHPHNDFLSVAVDGGLVTLAAYLVLWGVIIWQMIRMIRKSEANEKLLWLPRAGLALTAGICFAGLFQNYMSDAEVGGAVWFSLGLVFSAGSGE